MLALAACVAVPTVAAASTLSQRGDRVTVTIDPTGDAIEIAPSGGPRGTWSRRICR